MIFFKEVNNILLEAYKEPKRKDVSRGLRTQTTQQQEGPTGLTKSTVGSSEFGHFKSKDFTKNPLADTKAQSVRKSEIVLRNVFRILKSNPAFREKLDSILTRYSKTRKQIRHDQEHVLSYNPSKIDSLFTQIMRIEKVLKALGPRDKRYPEFFSELNELKEKFDEYSTELDQVYDQMLDVIGQNEENSLEYQEKIINECQRTAREEYDKLVDTISVEEKGNIVFKSFEEVENHFIDDEEFDQDLVRLEHLNLILSEDENQNPLYMFFDLANQKYNETKGTDENFKKLVYRTHNISVETLWNRLPTSVFTYFYNAAKDDLPLRKLTKGRRKQLKSFQPIKDVLNMIKSEEDFETYKYNLGEMINNMDMDAGRRKAIDEILAGPYKRRGATAVQRIQGLLRGILREQRCIDILSDETYLDILASYNVY